MYVCAAPVYKHILLVGNEKSKIWVTPPVSAIID